MVTKVITNPGHTTEGEGRVTLDLGEFVHNQVALLKVRVGRGSFASNAQKFSLFSLSLKQAYR